jgi:hypothetical protein
MKKYKNSFYCEPKLWVSKICNLLKAKIWRYRASPMIDRVDKIIEGLPVVVGRGLEIAPLNRPTLRKSDCLVDYTDYLPAEALREIKKVHTWSNISWYVGWPFPVRLLFQKLESGIISRIPNSSFKVKTKP